MPDNERPKERDIERDLRDLGARIEYPPTPDLARAVRRRLDEQEGRRSPGRGFWPSLLSPRWAVPVAALVLISFALLSPAVRAPLSDILFSGHAASSGGGAVSETGDSAARPESGGSAARPEPQAAAGPESSRSSVAGGSRGEDQPMSGGGGSVAPQSSMAESAGSVAAEAGATGCPSPSLEAEPARAAAGAKFRLRGNNFSSGCAEIGPAQEIRPAQDVRIAFRQDGKTWTLATVDADRNLTFDAGLRVPAGAEPGRATVRATPRSGGLVEEQFLVLR
jgi:hypothetical protein